MPLFVALVRPYAAKEREAHARKANAYPRALKFLVRRLLAPTITDFVKSLRLSSARLKLIIMPLFVALARL